MVSKKLANFMRMLTGLFTFLDAQPVIVDTLPAFRRSVNSGKEKLAALKARIDQRGGRSTNKTEGKANVEDELTGFLIKFTSALSLYSADEEKHDLHQETNETPSYIIQLDDAELAEFARNRIPLTEAHLASLADYGITAEDITEANALLTGFEEVNGLITSTLRERPAVTEDIEKMVSDIRLYLKERLDKYPNILKKEHPAFFEEYRKQRIIIDYNGNPGAGDDEDPPVTPPEP